MIRIVIVSDKEPELNIIQESVNSQNDISIVGHGRDGYEAIKLVAKLRPDIAILDESLPILNGADITPTLKCQSPGTRIIILASFHDNSQVLKAINYGASGYLQKNTPREKIISGIRTVSENGCLMTPEIAAKAFRMYPNANRNIPKAFFTSPCLSRQEFQIILCIAKGLSNKKIGARLSLKEGTVRNYITTILNKIHLKNRTQIAVYAYYNGLINDEQDEDIRDERPRLKGRLPAGA
jgi:DNA-binding NarL/FixJ family response regulator